MSPNKNYGLRETLPRAGAHIFGSAKLPIIMQNRSWAGFLPQFEAQSDGLFDSYSCVTFATFNCLETYLLYLNIQKNFSDRFTAVMSGTLPNVGNYIDAPGRSIANDGIVDEKEYPFVSGEKYFETVPKDTRAQAKKNIGFWNMQSEWVDWSGCETERLWDALQYSPLAVTVLAWYPQKDGMYQNTGSDKTNHVVMLFAGEYKKWWLIYDHYEQSIKKLSWDFYFGSAMKHILLPRMLQLVKGDKSIDIFAVSPKGTKHLVFDEAQFEAGVEIGLWKREYETLKQKDVDALSQGKAIVLA